MGGAETGALTASIISVVVTGVVGIWVAVITARQGRHATDRTASVTDAERISRDLWEMVRHEREARKEADDESERSRKDAEMLRAALETAGREWRLNDVQALIYARRLAVEVSAYRKRAEEEAAEMRVHIRALEEELADVLARREADETRFVELKTAYDAIVHAYEYLRARQAGHPEEN